MSEPSIASRRTYDNRARQQKAAQTRERIVAAGSELVHDFDSWNWRDLTFKAVAERAGVGERTVYRHFPTERHLHDAVMQRLESEAGISYEDVDLTNIGDVTARVFASLQRFSVRKSVEAPQDPTFVGVDVRRRDALARAVSAAAPGWSAAEQQVDGGPSRRAVECAQLRAAGRGMGHRRGRRNPRDRLADGQGRRRNRGRRPAACVACASDRGFRSRHRTAPVASSRHSPNAR